MNAEGHQSVAAASATSSDVDREYARDDLEHGEAAGGCALIKVAAVGLPDALAVGEPLAKRDRRVGEIVERQQERGGELAAPRQKNEQPAEQETDRQAADIAEKEPRHRPVEGGEADERAEERERHDDRRRRQAAGDPEQHDAGADRHGLCDRHPVDAVHEVDEVDEPQPAEHQQSALDPPRQHGDDVQFRRQRHDDGADGNGLQHEPRADIERTDVVDGA